MTSDLQHRRHQRNDRCENPNLTDTTPYHKHIHIQTTSSFGHHDRPLASAFIHQTPSGECLHANPSQTPMRSVPSQAPQSQARLSRSHRTQPRRSWNRRGFALVPVTRPTGSCRTAPMCLRYFLKPELDLVLVMILQIFCCLSVPVSFYLFRYFTNARTFALEGSQFTKTNQP